ncbi:hypothetical protein [Microbacterium sp. NPDC055665]
MSKTKTTRSAQTVIRERVRAARAAQLAEQRLREQRIEDAATAFFLSADSIDRLAAERERVLEEFAQKHALLEQEQGRAVGLLRELETVATIADLVGISTADVSRLSKLVEPAAPTRSRAEETSVADAVTEISETVSAHESAAEAAA